MELILAVSKTRVKITVEGTRLRWEVRDDAQSKVMIFYMNRSETEALIAGAKAETKYLT